MEVLAASIWRAGEDPFYREKGLITRKLVRRQWFSGVSEEDDLRIPVAKWLRSKGYDPYMEIPLGLGKVDVLGFLKAGITATASEPEGYEWARIYAGFFAVRCLACDVNDTEQPEQDGPAVFAVP